MTKVSINEEKGHFGEDLVRRILETGWRVVVQPYEGYSDRGYDFLVQDRVPDRMTSLIFNVQVKTSDFGRRNLGDTFRVPAKLVNLEHVQLWRKSNVPVILVCVDAGPPPIAYWQIIRPQEQAFPVIMSRKQEFGPHSRDAVVAQIRRSFPVKLPPAQGDLLKFPLKLPIRRAAKNYYYKLKQKPLFVSGIGPVRFTWRGWRHITRRSRSMWKIRSSLLLLPCVRSVLDGGHPTDHRALKPICRGKLCHYRTLLVFERVITFPHRVPARMRVVLEAHSLLPKDWSTSPPYDPRRKLWYKFLSLWELKKDLEPTDLVSEG